MKSICFLLYSAARPLWCFFSSSNPCSPHRKRYTHKVNRMPRNLCLIRSAFGTWRRKGERANRRSRLGGLGGFLSHLFHCRCRRRGGYRTFGLERQKKEDFFFLARGTSDSLCVLCNTWICRRVCVCVLVCVCTCGAGGLSIWGLRICKASSRGVCFFLNFPSGLLNTSP